LAAEREENCVTLWNLPDKTDESGIILLQMFIVWNVERILIGLYHLKWLFLEFKGEIVRREGVQGVFDIDDCDAVSLNLNDMQSILSILMTEMTVFMWMYNVARKCNKELMVEVVLAPNSCPHNMAYIHIIYEYTIL